MKSLGPSVQPERRGPASQTSTWSGPRLARTGLMAALAGLLLVVGGDELDLDEVLAGAQVGELLVQPVVHAALPPACRDSILYLHHQHDAPCV